jgi:CHAT domain-containing protein/Tfp pilus assembly protein PilF
MARCLRHAERREEARAAHEKALSMSRDLGVAGLQGENANLLGLLDYEAGKLQRAIDLFSQALPLAREAGDQGTEYRALNNLAASHELLGHVQEALTLYLEALRMARAIPKPKDEIIFLNNLGETYRSLGELEKALEHYRLAIEKSDALKDRLLSSRFLINQASAYRQKGQLDSARLSLERALALAREIPSRREQVLALGQLAFLALALQQQESAIGYAREAVSLAKSLEEQTIAKYALGSALRVVGETGDAQTALTEALGLAIRRAERGQQAEISLALARMERDAGRLDSALQRIQSAIHLIESRRGGLVDLKLRTSFLASRQDYYHFEIDTLMGLHAKSPASGFAAAALQVSETARARGLLDLLNEADVGLGADPALLEKLRQVREEMNEREYGRARLAAESPDSEKLLEAEKKLNAALEEYQKVQVELRQSSPSYEALTQPRILGVAEIQQQILDGKALFLEYSLGAQRSFLWAVGPDSFASFELAGREEIERAARLYYELLTVRNNKRPGESVPAWKARIKQADGEVESAAHELSRRILDPVEKMLGDRTLLIVADGALQYIPFAALPVPGTGDPLASRHEIVNLPSASVLAILRREPRERPATERILAIFANPVFQKNDRRLAFTGRADQDQLTQKPPANRNGEEEGAEIDFRPLLHSEKEANAIADLVSPNQVFKAVGFEATREAVVSGRLKGYRNLHFATHGVLDSQRPELSSLVLSLYDRKGERLEGFLRLADIYSLRLDADLVVLSACQTALGKEIRGEGLVGLTRGFMNAGAGRVLASLWSVQDEPTAKLMTLFYRGMLKEDLSAAAALRKAQLEMAQDPDRKSPYYWAGFSLQGEWR